MAGINNKTAAEAVKEVTDTPAVADNSAALQEQVNQLTVDKAKLAKQVDDLSEALANANQDKDELEEQLTDERSRSGDLAGELNEAENLIEDLQKRLERAATLQAQSDTVIVSDGTHDYKVLAPKFKHKHVEYTAEQLRDNEALVQELVAAEIGFLQKIEIEK